MATVQQNSQTNDLVEHVYNIIQSRSGSITSKDLDRILGNKQEVRFAITRITLQYKIKRIKGLGKHGIEYFYHDTASPEIQKYYRRLEKIKSII